METLGLPGRGTGRVLCPGGDKTPACSRRAAAGIQAPVPRLSSPAGGTKCPEVAERRASVKAETSGLAPGLDCRPPLRWWVGKAANPLTVLGRPLL